MAKHGPSAPWLRIGGMNWGAAQGAGAFLKLIPRLSGGYKGGMSIG